jgi:hypothetical protein
LFLPIISIFISWGFINENDDTVSNETVRLIRNDEQGKPGKEWIAAHFKTPPTHLLEVTEEHYQPSSKQQIKEPRFEAGIVATIQFILYSMDDDI